MQIIGAVIRAAVTIATVTLSPLRKFSTLAGLAGQVLRLFRGRKELTSVSESPELNPPADRPPVRLREGSSKDDRTVTEPTGSVQRRRKGGSRHG